MSFPKMPVIYLKGTTNAKPAFADTWFPELQWSEVLLAIQGRNFEQSITCRKKMRLLFLQGLDLVADDSGMDDAFKTDCAALMKIASTHISELARHEEDEL